MSPFQGSTYFPAVSGGGAQAPPALCPRLLHPAPAGLWGPAAYPSRRRVRLRSERRSSLSCRSRRRRERAACSREQRALLSDSLVSAISLRICASSGTTPAFLRTE